MMRAIGVLGLAVLALAAGGPRRAQDPPHVLTIGGPVTREPIPPGFLGLSFEYWAVPLYAGQNPRQVNPVFLQLIRNLAGGEPPDLRIGGVTTDTTWWPIPGASTPPGMVFGLNRRWIDVIGALAAALDARLILGINLEADSAQIAAAEARALIAGIGRGRIEALELGNEPELYGAFSWGLSGVPGRSSGYDFTAFEGDYSRIARALPHVSLAGPTTGTVSLFGDLAGFLSDEPRVAVATLHRYPLQRCFATPSQAIYPTVAHLLAPNSSRSLADSVAAAVRIAHAHHLPLRIDEMNSVSCGQHYVPGVTRSFASALWVLDALFEMARVGVDGVNIHSYPAATYSPFAFRRVRGRWRARVEPDYYGLAMFAQAAPAGSRLLGVSPTGFPQLNAWATRARDGTVRITVINEGTRARTVAVRPPARPGAPATATATLERLEAPSLTASSRITLAGQTFGAGTGLPVGRRRAWSLTPTGGRYVFRVPAASAAMLTIA